MKIRIVFDRRGKAVVAGLFAIGLLSAAAPASAAVRYAEPGVGGANVACPQSDPCDILEAVNDAAVGDEVIVLSGTYVISDALSVSGAGTQVHGQVGQPRPVIHTSASTGLILGNAFAAVRDLTILHTGAGRAIFLFGKADRIFAASQNGVACEFFTVGTESRLRDSVCWARAGIDPAIDLLATGDFARTRPLRNVTAISAGGAGIRAETSEGSMTVDAKSVIARGSTVSGSQPDVDAAAAGGTTVSVQLDHSNYDTRRTLGPGSATVTAPGSGANQTAAPQFVNAGAGDFHQAGTSPTIDAGAVDAQSGSLDLDRNPRAQGSAPDIGAFESPENDFTIGKRKRRKREKRKGTATIRMSVPGAGSLVLARTKKVKGGEASAGGPDPKVTMEVRPRGKAKRKLNKVSEENPKMKVKVKAKVTYTPVGGAPLTKSKRVKLVKKL